MSEASIPKPKPIPLQDPRFQQFLRHLEAGRQDEAMKVLAQVLKSDPGQAAAYVLLVGAMLAQSGKYDEAIPLYQEAIRLNPDEPRAYFYLGVAHHARGDEEACNRIWDELTKRFRGDAMDHYQRGLRLLRENKLPEGKSELERALALTSKEDPIQKDLRRSLEAIDRGG